MIYMKKTKKLYEETPITISLCQRTCIRKAGNKILKNFRKIARLPPVIYVPKLDLNYSKIKNVYVGETDKCNPNATLL